MRLHPATVLVVITEVSKPADSKGYQKPKRSPEQLRKVKPQMTLLRGYTGLVTELWFKIDAELKRRDWNWGDLSDRLHCKRQYLEQLTNQPNIPESTFHQICSILGWNAAEMIQREMPEDADDST